jgi:hypothetical protein
MRQRSDLIVAKQFDTESSLLTFLNELDKKYNLTQIIIAIVPMNWGKYQLFYKDFSKETEADRLC